MKFGVREICDVVLRAKAKQTLGSRTFYKNEPVLYFDTLKTSSLEGAATTVYATGGRGNSRLIAWEGERTLTFTFEDALISPEGFAILSGAGLVAASEDRPIFVHTTSQVEVKNANTIEIPAIACWTAKATGEEEEVTKFLPEGTAVKDFVKEAADIYVMVLDGGEVAEEPCVPASITYGMVFDKEKNKEVPGTIITCYSHKGKLENAVVLVDYYVRRTSGAQMIEITADKFAGNYYLEASTLFRRESDGVDMPAEFIIPNGKIQSNFNFAMASSGDPSTFTFTMDAFPDYTKFDRTRKVLAAIQVITGEEVETGEKAKEFREICEEHPAVAGE